MQYTIPFLFLHVCLSLADCRECTAQSECVWCEKNPTVGCLLGGMFGPEDPTYTCLSGDWRWKQCDTQGLYVISTGIGLSFLISCCSLCTCAICFRGVFRRKAAYVEEYLYDSGVTAEGIPQELYEYEDWNPEEVQRLFAAAHPAGFGSTPSYNNAPTQEEIRKAELYEKFGV